MNENNEVKIIKIMIKAFFISIIIFILMIVLIPENSVAKILNVGYFDKSAKDIGELTEDQNKILEELQKYADASNFSFEVNSTMVFENGRVPGTIYIANPENNHLNMIVDIYLDSTNELVYKSGVLKPGDYIEKDSLRVFLEGGTYDATANISAVAPTTGDVIGEVELDIVINILG